MKKLKIILPLLCMNFIYGAEADHYTRYNEPLEDMLEVINKEANVSLEKAIMKTNAESTSCNAEVLVENMQEYFANHASGKLVIDILHEKKFAKREIKLDDSIYGGWSLFEGLLLNINKTSPLALSPMIRMGEFIIGVDKLEHMFGMGSRYYKEYYLEGKSLSSVLRKGIFKEKTILGGNILATGVFSYADLSANFNGMRFWNHVLMKNDDIIGQNIKPYVKCVDNKFIANEESPIDFSYYIDASMDESINCSKYAAKKAFKRVKKAFRKKSKALEMEVSCPMSWSQFDELQDKYNIVVKDDRKKRTLSDFILNEEGPGTVSYFNEF